MLKVFVSNGAAASALYQPSDADFAAHGEYDTVLLDKVAQTLRTMASGKRLPATTADALRHAAHTVLLLKSGFDDLNAHAPLAPTLFHRFAEKFVLIAAGLQKLRGYTAELQLLPGYRLAFCIGHGEPVLTLTLPPDERDDAVRWIAHAMRMAVDKELADNGAALADVGVFIDLNIEAMSNDHEVRRFLQAHLDNPAFGRAHLRQFGVHRVENVVTLERFVASYDEQQSIVFSNRGSQKSELRGASLRAALTSASYGSLREMLTARHLGADDAGLRYAMAPIKMRYCADDDAPWPLSPSDRAVLSQSLSAIRVGNTTLDRIFAMTDSAAPPPGLIDEIDTDGYVIVNEPI